MNARVDFYLLGSTDVTSKYTYACRIASKAFGQGMKVYLQTDEPGQNELLDKMLWTFSQSSFIPHIVHEGVSHDVNRYPVQIGSASAVDCRTAQKKAGLERAKNTLTRRIGQGQINRRAKIRSRPRGPALQRLIGLPCSDQRGQ